MESYGGGYKINLLREALEPYKNDDEKIILFTDRYISIIWKKTKNKKQKIIKWFFSFFSSYDVVFTTNLEVIVHKFKKFGARILFGAEKYLWPDEQLEHLYPTVSKHLPRYLNSGLFMGRFQHFKSMILWSLSNRSIIFVSFILICQRLCIWCVQDAWDAKQK